MKEEEELRGEGKGKGQKERRVSVGSQVSKSYDCERQVEASPSGSQFNWCRQTMLVSLDHADVEVWMCVKAARGSQMSKWTPNRSGSKMSKRKSDVPESDVQVEAKSKRKSDVWESDLQVSQTKRKPGQVEARTSGSQAGWKPGQAEAGRERL